MSYMHLYFVADILLWKFAVKPIYWKLFSES